MIPENLSGRILNHYNKEGHQGQIRYDELYIRMGEDRRLSLVECLDEEHQRISLFRQSAGKISKLIRSLDPFYEEIERDLAAFYRQAEQKVRDINDLSYSRRIRLLNSYYTLNSKHERILRKLTDYLLAGSEGDHSAHNISLLRLAIDYTCRVMRSQTRKTSQPVALHAIEAARGAAKNGLRIITIIATLLHDVLEERLDEWTEKLINTELEDPIFGEYAGKKMKEVPPALRHKIIAKHMSAYNDRATGIFFAMGLNLYAHARHFPVPVRHYESLNSIVQMVAALSRRRDQSYYSYLQQLLYPKADADLNTIEYDRLREELLVDIPNVDDMLDPYLNYVHTFYETPLGQFSSKEEVRRNTFREILAKILDRMNNTRDMDRKHGFSIPARLYGTGFKNIFFLQAIEDKLRRPSFNTEERRLIEMKFINKPKVAALFQILDDIEFMRKEYDCGELFDFLEKEIECYKATSAFSRLTPPGRGGYFNGLIYLFNDITLGRKSNLVELEKRHDKIAEVLVAFRAVLESFLVYPALINNERQEKNLGPREDCGFSTYRIKGMGPSLEQRSSAAKERSADGLDLKTFSRQVI